MKIVWANQNYGTNPPPLPKAKGIIAFTQHAKLIKQ
jgi:hypothetical protein